MRSVRKRTENRNAKMRWSAFQIVGRVTYPFSTANASPIYAFNGATSALRWATVVQSKDTDRRLVWVAMGRSMRAPTMAGYMPSGSIKPPIFCDRFLPGAVTVLYPPTSPPLPLEAVT